MALLAAGPVRGEPLAHRSWQFHDPDWDHLQKAIPRAAAEGMNRIQLSHQIVMDAEELWEGSGHEKRLERVGQAIDLAHENGLKVDMWTHELSGLPKDRFREGDRGKPVLSPELWKWVEDKYEHLFKLVPALDGVVLTFAETDHKVYGDGVVSDLTPPQRVARLIEVMGDVCRQRDKLLIVRTFVYEPAEIAFLHEALSRIAADTPPDGHIIVMTKCVPHDWTPYYPFNPLLGEVAGLPQVVEIDLGQEFTGQSRILHGEVGYVKRVLDHARAKGVIGAVARVERGTNHALGTPNEVNLHAFGRLLHDGSLSEDALWREWVVGRYGQAAAPHVIRALRRTFDITNLTYFPLEYWIVNHSRVPDWGYAYGHITSRQNAKWIPSPKQLRARDELLRPTPDTLVRIAHEKDLAARLSELSLADLEKAAPHLADEDVRELRRYLELGRDNVEAFRRHNLAMFAVLCHQARAEAGDVSPEEIKAIAAGARDHIRSLREWADVMEQRYGPEIWPGNPGRLRGFANGAEKRLER
jgi:hypothetical protein